MLGNHNNNNNHNDGKNPSQIIHSERSPWCAENDKGSNTVLLCSSFPYFSRRLGKLTFRKKSDVQSNVKFIVYWIFTSLNMMMMGTERECTDTRRPYVWTWTNATKRIRRCLWIHSKSTVTFHAWLTKSEFIQSILSWRIVKR